MRLRDKVVVITGVASGIGRATATVCGEEGALLVLADLPTATGLSEIGSLADRERAPLVVPTDVTRLEDCQALARAAESRWGRIDAVVKRRSSGWLASISPEASSSPRPSFPR